MNTLVLYDSQFGNTEQIAQAIAQTLSEHGPARAERVNQARPSEAEGVGLLVLGCPTQKWSATPATKAFLDLLPKQLLHGMAVACFDTRFDKSSWLTGSAAKGMAKQLKKLGATLITPPESFFVEAMEGPLASGELERATRWARQIHDKIAQSEAHHEPASHLA
jgi:flavodoxin